MNTLEYLQLTSEDLNRYNKHSGFFGVFIYGNSKNGILFRKFERGIECLDIKNNMIHGEYKYWNTIGKLSIYCLYDKGNRIKDFLKENKNEMSLL